MKSQRHNTKCFDDSRDLLSLWFKYGPFPHLKECESVLNNECVRLLIHHIHVIIFLHVSTKNIVVFYSDTISQV